MFHIFFTGKGWAEPTRAHSAPSRALRARVCTVWALRSRVWAGSRMPLPPERCAPASAPSPARRRLLSSPSSPALPLTHIRLDWGREEMPTWVTVEKWDAAADEMRYHHFNQ